MIGVSWPNELCNVASSAQTYRRCTVPAAVVGAGCGLRDADCGATGVSGGRTVPVGAFCASGTGVPEIRAVVSAVGAGDEVVLWSRPLGKAPVDECGDGVTSAV